MKRTVARELMDDVVESMAELEGNLSDIEFGNRVFGGVPPVLREVRRAGARTVLDICCGSGDIVRALARDAERAGGPLALTALDRSEQMLAIARARTGENPDITFVAGDALALPFADGSFDVVTCNLALHHFEPAAARTVLREMRRVARIMPLVSDLRRSRPAFVATLMWSRIFSRNRLTRHDAPLSVRRAYDGREAQRLAIDAGWRAPRVRSEPFFRMTLLDAATRLPAGIDR